ncbi:MAG: hypothetical protein AB1776_02860 [Bacillota bacterium]
MRAVYFLCLTVAAAAVFYHAWRCVEAFNRFVAPEEPVRLVEVRRLDRERVLLDFMGVRLVLALPDELPSVQPGVPAARPLE